MLAYQTSRFVPRQLIYARIRNERHASDDEHIPNLSREFSQVFAIADDNFVKFATCRCHNKHRFMILDFEKSVIARVTLTCTFTHYAILQACS